MWHPLVTFHNCPTPWLGAKLFVKDYMGWSMKGVTVDGDFTFIKRQDSEHDIEYKYRSVKIGSDVQIQADEGTVVRRK